MYIGDAAQRRADLAIVHAVELAAAISHEHVAVWQPGHAPRHIDALYDLLDAEAGLILGERVAYG